MLEIKTDPGIGFPVADLLEKEYVQAKFWRVVTSYHAPRAVKNNAILNYFLPLWQR